MDRREFVEQYKRNVEPIDLARYRQQAGHQISRTRQRNTKAENTRRYVNKRGSVRNKKRKINTKLAALILAGAIGIGGISLANHHEANKTEPVNMIEMQKEGVNLQSLGLHTETIELFEKYDNYFDEFDKDSQNGLTEEQVVNMINEIRQMHFMTVKEKTGSLVGEDPKNIKMYYGFDSGSGETYSYIVLNEDSYNEEVYHSAGNLILPNDNHIPSELRDVIVQVETLEELVEDVRTDRITKVNAVKRLERLYEELEQVATGEFIQDERGNISIIHYESKELDNEQERDGRD